MARHFNILCAFAFILGQSESWTSVNFTDSNEGQPHLQARFPASSSDFMSLDELQVRFKQAGYPAKSADLLNNITVSETYTADFCKAEFDPYSRILQIPQGYFQKCAKNELKDQLFFTLFAFSNKRYTILSPAIQKYYGVSVASSIELQESLVKKMGLDFSRLFRSSTKNCELPFLARHLGGAMAVRFRSCNDSFKVQLNSALENEELEISPEKINRIELITTSNGKSEPTLLGAHFLRFMTCQAHTSGKCSKADLDFVVQLEVPTREKEIKSLTGLLGQLFEKRKTMVRALNSKEFFHDAQEIYKQEIEIDPVNLSQESITRLVLILRQLIHAEEKLNLGNNSLDQISGMITLAINRDVSTGLFSSKKAFLEKLYQDMILPQKEDKKSPAENAKVEKQVESSPLLPTAKQSTANSETTTQLRPEAAESNIPQGSVEAIISKVNYIHEHEWSKLSIENRTAIYRSIKTMAEKEDSLESKEYINYKNAFSSYSKTYLEQNPVKSGEDEPSPRQLEEEFIEKNPPEYIKWREVSLRNAKLHQLSYLLQATIQD